MGWLQIRKKLFIFLIILFVIIFTVCNIVSTNTNSKQEFDKLINEYNIVANMIKNNDLEVKSNGCVNLTEKYEHLSDGGECFVICFNDETGIYFYTYRGIIDSSKGYVYVTDKFFYNDYIDTENYNPEIEFVKIDKVDEKLYSCATG